LKYDVYQLYMAEESSNDENAEHMPETMYMDVHNNNHTQIFFDSLLFFTKNSGRM